MNNERRSIIAEIKDDIDEIRAKIDEVRDEEQDALDNLSDAFREGIPGQRMEDVISALEEASNTLDTVDQQLDLAAQKNKKKS